MKRVLLALVVLFASTQVFARGGGHAHGDHSSGSGSGSGAKSAHVHVSGYTKKNGTHVNAHDRSTPDHTKNNNWSTKGNINPETGKPGTKKGDGE